MAKTTENKNPLDIPDEELDNFNWDAIIDQEPETEPEELLSDSLNPVEEGEVTKPVEEDPVTPNAELDVTPETPTIVEKEVIDPNVVKPVVKTKEVEVSQDPVIDDKTAIEESGAELEGSDETAEGDKPEAVEGEPVTKETKEATTTEKEKTDIPAEAINYEDEYKKILAPFKANGHMIELDKSEDVIKLMQMGANYNKKMIGLKPSLRIVKMLEDQGLLNEDKINRLIDLDKKDPEAIKQLIKDSGLDLLSFDPEKEVKYKPNTYNVKDKDVELDRAIQDIRETETGQTTLNFISTEWDERSHQEMVNDPNILRILNDHKQSGIFDQVSAVVEKEKLLGRLNGLSDLDAFMAVGDKLQAEGKFVQSTNSPQNTELKQKVANVIQQKQVVDPKLNEKRKAASSTNNRGLPTKNNSGGINPLSLSDAEFEKVSSDEFLQ